MPEPSRSPTPTWESPVPARGAGIPLALAAGLALAATAALAVAAGPLVALAILLMGILVAFAARRVQGGRLVRRLGASPAADSRLRNVAAGIASDLGRPSPDLFVAPGDPNAFVVPGGRGGIVVTERLLAACSRTELEAVVASCLVRLDASALRHARWLALGRPLAHFGAPVFDLDLDVAAAALTRYPPALAAAIDKAAPRSDWTAPFAFVAAPPWQREPDVRALELRDL